MRIIRPLAIAGIITVLFTACGGSDSNAVSDQREAIIKFLETNDLEYEKTQNVFRHFGQRGEEQANTIKQGDRVEFYFELYPSRYSRASGSANPLAPIPTTALYSNKAFIIDTLSKKGLDASFWPDEIYNATVGSGDLIKGLNRGLEGCREGDSVLLFITSDLAYGKKPVVNLEENTAILYIVNIETVTNR